METTKPILVVQTAFLGDLLLAIPLLKRIRYLRPQADLHIVCRKGLGSLLLSLKLVDHVHEIEKSKWATYQAVIDDFQTQSFEWILSPHLSLTSARLVAKLKAAHKVSFSLWWNSFFYDRRVVKNFNLPDALRQLSLLQPFDPETKERLQKYSNAIPVHSMGPVPDWASMSCQSDLQVWAQLNPHSLSLPGNYICIFPGSVWATKQWTEEGFAEVALQLSHQKIKVLWMGGPGEEALGERLSQAVPGSVNLVAKTSLLQSLSILMNALLVIANDSSGQHLAAVADVPSVSIFGPTVPAFGFRPWNPRSRIVENLDIDCRPCGPHGHRVCPRGHHNCMKLVSSATVFESAKSLIMTPR